MTHPYSIYVWQPAQGPGEKGVWIEPAQIYTEQYAVYLANLYTCVVILLVALAYIIASAWQAPLSLVALGGGLVLLIEALLWKQITLKALGGQILNR